MTDMQDLRAWLAWATTETHVPAAERAIAAPKYAIALEAAENIREHATGITDGSKDIAWCLEHHPDAFRALVLAWAAAVEAMRAAVPACVAYATPASVVEPMPMQRTALDAPRPEFMKAPERWEGRLVAEYADPCPACQRNPCEGTHMSCSVDRYLAENPGVKDAAAEWHRARMVHDTAELDRLCDWQPAPRPAPNWLRSMVERVDRDSVERVNRRLLAADMFERVAENFDPFCCTGCGCRDGEAHRPGRGCDADEALHKLYADR